MLTRARQFGDRPAASAIAVAVCVTLAGTPSAVAAVARADAPATPTTSAAAAAPGDPGTRLVLTGQDAWTVVGGTLTLRLQISANAPVPAADSIAFTAHSSFTSRAAFLGSFASSGSQLGSTLGVVTVPVATLHPDSTGSVSVPIGLQDPNLPRDTNRLPLRRTGVYPVEIELRDASDRGIEGTRFVTQAVVVAPGSNGAPPIAKRLQVAWVWPLVDGPSRRVDDSIDPKVLADLQPDGRLGRQVAALGHANGVPVTLVPSARDARGMGGSRPDRPGTRGSGPDVAGRPHDQRGDLGFLRSHRHGFAARPQPQRRRGHRAVAAARRR